MSDTFDIFVGNEKKGIFHDTNPCIIDTDHECINTLNSLKKDLILSDSELDLVNQCIDTAKASPEDDVVFGPGEIIELGLMATRHPSKVYEIMACFHHLLYSVECEGDLPPNIFLNVASAYGSLSSLIRNDSSEDIVASD